jgi:hypothetical protein
MGRIDRIGHLRLSRGKLRSIIIHGDEDWRAASGGPILSEAKRVL